MGAEVGSVLVCSGVKIPTTITNSDTAVPTFRNFLAGGFVKGTAARETDVSGGETGKNTDKIYT